MTARKRPQKYVRPRQRRGRNERRGEEGGEKSELDALRAESEAAGAHLVCGALGINEVLGIRATVKKGEGCVGLHGECPG